MYLVLNNGNSMNDSDNRNEEIGPIGERIKELIGHYRMNMNSLSVRLQLSTNSNLSRVVNDPKRGVSMALIQKILSEFRDISAEWLVMGRGEMLKEKTIVEQPKPGDFGDVQTTLKQKDELIDSLKSNLADLRAYNRSLEDRVVSLTNRVTNLQEIAGLPKKEAG